MRHTRAAIPVLTILVSSHCPAELMPPVPTRGTRTLRIFLCSFLSGQGYLGRQRGSRISSHVVISQLDLS